MNTATPVKNCSCGRTLEANHCCGICQVFYCKKCIEFLPQQTFSFMKNIPAELAHTEYCLTCFAVKIQPELRDYKELMKRASEVFILDKPERKAPMVLRKHKHLLRVEDCPDREETMLRLAFLAAELGFNSVIKVNIEHRKVRNAGYQKLLWTGTGLAVDLDGRKLD